MQYISSIIKKLFSFWEENGCTSILSYDFPMGAATFHPECFFGSFSNKPMAIIYLQPSRRKADGRYGLSPNRLFSHCQVQVFITPAPENIMNLFKKSLEAIGISSLEHNISFIDNNWESASIGASGVGWEVVVDKMEVAQFTYFQEMAGAKLKNIPVEIAYGLERLCMFSLPINSIYDASWNKNITYKDLFFNRESQFSQFFLEENNFITQEDFEKKFNIAKHLLQKELYLPAYEILLEMIDIFNSLDAMKKIGEFERKNYIGKMKEISCECRVKFEETMG